jgi:hypothetical protein
VATVLDALTYAGANDQPAVAVILTQNGKTTEAPISIAVASDVPLLHAKVALTR